MKNKIEQFSKKLSELELQFRTTGDVVLFIEQIDKLLEGYLNEFKGVKQVYSFKDNTSCKYEYSSVVISISFNKEEELHYGKFKELDFMCDEYMNFITFKRFIVYGVKRKT